MRGLFNRRNERPLARIQVTAAGSTTGVQHEAVKARNPRSYHYKVDHFLKGGFEDSFFYDGLRPGFASTAFGRVIKN